MNDQVAPMLFTQKRKPPLNGNSSKSVLTGAPEYGFESTSDDEVASIIDGFEARSAPVTAKEVEETFNKGVLSKLTKRQMVRVKIAIFNRHLAAAHTQIIVGGENYGRDGAIKALSALDDALQTLLPELRVGHILTIIWHALLDWNDGLQPILLRRTRGTNGTPAEIDFADQITSAAISLLIVGKPCCLKNACEDVAKELNKEGWRSFLPNFDAGDDPKSLKGIRERILKRRGRGGKTIVYDTFISTMRFQPRDIIIPCMIGMIGLYVPQGATKALRQKRKRRNR